MPVGERGGGEINSLGKGLNRGRPSCRTANNTTGEKNLSVYGTVRRFGGCCVERCLAQHVERPSIGEFNSRPRRRRG